MQSLDKGEGSTLEEVQLENEGELTVAVAKLKQEIAEQEMELKLQEKHLGLVTQQTHQLNDFMANFDEVGKLHHVNRRQSTTSPGSHHKTTKAASSPAKASNPLRAGSRKNLLRRKVARKILKNKLAQQEEGRPFEVFHDAVFETPALIRQAVENKRDSVGSVGSIGSVDGLTPETREIKEQGYIELMNAWRGRRGMQGGLWAWRQQLQNGQVQRDLHELGQDQWELNQRLCYFLNFTEHHDAHKLRRKTKADLAKAEAKLSLQTPTKKKPVPSPARTPGTVAGRVKRDARGTANVMTRTERLQADKRNRTKGGSPSKAHKGPMENLNGAKQAWVE